MEAMKRASSEDTERVPDRIKSQVDPKNVFGNGNLVGDGKGKIPTSHL